MKKKTKYVCAVPSCWDVQCIGGVRYELIIISLMKTNETLETEIDKERGIER